MPPAASRVSHAPSLAMAWLLLPHAHLPVVPELKSALCSRQHEPQEASQAFHSVFLPWPTSSSARITILHTAVATFPQARPFRGGGSWLWLPASTPGLPVKSPIILFQWSVTGVSLRMGAVSCSAPPRTALYSGNSVS